MMIACNRMLARKSLSNGASYLFRRKLKDGKRSP